MARYCRGVDRLDAELIRSAYHADGVDEHGELSGTRDAFVDELIPVLRRNYLATSHQITNQLVDLAGDTAFVESYVTAVHKTEVDDVRWQEIAHGRYLDRFERRDGKWRIAHRLVVVHSRNAREVAPSRLATDEARLVRGSRDRSDPSYGRGRWSLRD